MGNNLAIHNDLAILNNLRWLIYAPTSLIIASTVRLVISYHQSLDSVKNCHYRVQSFPTLLLCVSTWLIWQCYFANSLASVQAFHTRWGLLTFWQRWLFYIVGLPLLLMAFVVGVGLLQVTDGPSPSPLLQMIILTPAALWSIPVILSATVTVFGVNVCAAVEQMQERALTHIVHLLLYFVFLRSSHLDALLGAGSIGVCAMFGVTFLGFILQVLWSVYPYMAARLLDERAAYPQQEQEPGQSVLVTGVSHRRPFAMNMEGPNDLLVGVCNRLPSLSDTDELVMKYPTVPRIINT